MSELQNSTGLSALIQVQTAKPTASLRQSLNESLSAEKTSADDDAKAVEAAQKFEAMLIHSMLKGMRKTTMAENTSNERSLYDDMLDEQMAATLVESGGLGVAEQIVSQIRGQKAQTQSPPELSTEDTLRIRAMSQNRELSEHTSIRSQSDLSHASVSSLLTGLSDTDISRLRMISGVPINTDNDVQTEKRLNFLQPLVPHAKRSAARLGTAPEAVLAIAALETGWGQSVIKTQQGENSHNLFGIKASASDQSVARITTTEYIDNQAVTIQADFRVFENTAAAVDGFANFVLENPRYSNALEHASDPVRFLQELHNAGYATDPEYAQKAISVMKQIQSDPLPL